MSTVPRPMSQLFNILKKMDGHVYTSYQELFNKRFFQDAYQIHFVHIQGSTGAFPASVCHLIFKNATLGLADSCLTNRPRRMATADYLLRAFGNGVVCHALQNRGAQGSGSFQPLSLPPQVLKRSVVCLEGGKVRIAFYISLPGSNDNRVLARQAIHMFSDELTGIIATLKAWVAKSAQIENHCCIVEDMMTLQSQLSSYGLVAFIGDGAILPRTSGVSQAPLKDGHVAFYAPEKLAVEVHLANAGRRRGLGIRPGVNVLIGAGFHGKTTLLNALVKGVYPHIPGDGREHVITHPDAIFACAEDGRAVSGLDISGFINNMPGKVDAKNFWTRNASGSTSEASAIIEAVLSGAKFLLIDEDSSATNFLIKDENMRKLVPHDTITPLFDRVQELYKNFGVSTLIVVGGTSEYLGVADHVIAMQNYKPVCMMDQVCQLPLPEPRRPADPLIMSDKRRLAADNFDPSYRAHRLAKTISVRIKPLRLQNKILEYGNERLDLTKLSALVDQYQVLAIGYALLLARDKLKENILSPSELAKAIIEMINQKGIEIVCQDEKVADFLACPRRLEIACAINRLRNLKLKIVEE